MNDKNLISLNDDPNELFSKWYELAKKSEINDPNAMNLATVTKDNKPTSRIVLLKSFNSEGFIFYSNAKSKKGKSLKNNNAAALNFYWKSLKKQVRIEGTVSIISNELADEYFNSRPLESRIGAIASKQSDFLKNRTELINRVDNIKKNYRTNEITRPSSWVGYIVKPDLFEFWQEMPFRLHDRVEFIKLDLGWKSRNLYP